MSSRHGMTLLEVIVALAIAGVALSAGAAVLGFLTDTSARAGAASTATAANVRLAVRDWIAAAHLGTTGALRFSGSRAELEFITTAPTAVACGGDALTRVRMRPVDSEGRTQLMAVLHAWPAGDSTTLVLADSIRSFDVRYLPSVFGAKRWTGAWASANVLPAAIELTIGTRDLLASQPITVVIGERR